MPTCTYAVWGNDEPIMASAPITECVSGSPQILGACNDTDSQTESAEPDPNQHWIVYKTTENIAHISMLATCAIHITQLNQPTLATTIQSY